MLNKHSRQFCRKIRDSGSQLLQWDRAVFRGRRRELEEVQKALNTLLQKSFDPADQEEKALLTEKFNELLAADEVYWRQRSRVI